MFTGKQVPLTRLQKGESATILQISAGHGLVNRLYALGIMPGKRVTKISSILMGGPVTIQIDRSRVALGHHMASRILVQPDDSVKS